MVLHVVYRTYAGENRKPRSHGYSKAACFRSLLASLDDMGAPYTLTLAVDGAMPTELETLLRPGFAVETVTAGRASVSMRAALTVARRIACAPDDWFWIAEDDYLYRPGAMRALHSLLRTCAWSDYVTLFVPRQTNWHATHKSQPAVVVPAVHINAPDGTKWTSVGSTTCTYAVSRRALLEDRWTLLLSTIAGSPFDAATFSTLQGIRPYPWRHLLADTDGRQGVRGALKVVAKPLGRVVVNLVATSRARGARRLLAPQPDLAVHAELYEVADLAAW